MNLWSIRDLWSALRTSADKERITNKVGRLRRGRGDYVWTVSRRMATAYYYSVRVVYHYGLPEEHLLPREEVTCH